MGTARTCCIRYESKMMIMCAQPCQGTSLSCAPAGVIRITQLTVHQGTSTHGALPHERLFFIATGSERGGFRLMLATRCLLIARCNFLWRAQARVPEVMHYSCVPARCAGLRGQLEPRMALGRGQCPPASADSWKVCMKGTYRTLRSSLDNSPYWCGFRSPSSSLPPMATTIANAPGPDYGTAGVLFHMREASGYRRLCCIVLRDSRIDNCKDQLHRALAHSRV